MESNYLTINQLIEKYPFLTQNMVKNILYKNLDNIRERTVKKFGRRILINEDAFLKFIQDLPPSRENWQSHKNKINNEFPNQDQFIENLFSQIKILNEKISNLHRKFELLDFVLKMMSDMIKEINHKIKNNADNRN